MVKYKEYFQRMLEANKELFENFRSLHNKYALDEDKWQTEFNTEGQKILKLIHEWENKLCQQSEKAGYANYTGNLSEKFQAEVKKDFPLIDHVGIIVKKSPEFILKKINLN